MNHHVLPIIEDRIKKYKDEHRGDSPLYIILPSDEADNLIQEVKNKNGYDNNVVVTEFNGSKIVKDAALNPGEVRLSNELPETGS